jgi:hypothetical protein
VVALALAALAACRQDSPVNPTVDDLAGDWAGTITDSVAGAGTIRLTIGQRGPGLSGTWASTFADEAFNRSGSFSGTMVGSPFVLFLRPSLPIVCSPDVTLTGTLAMTTRVDGDRITGTYTIFNCSGVITGSVEAGRQ